MLHTLTALSFINGVAKESGKPYHMVKIETEELPGVEATAFASSEMKEWKVGDKVDIKIKEDGEYNGTPKYKFAIVDSTEGRFYKIAEFMAQISDDINAIKIALQIQDVPKEKKPRAHKTEAQKETAQKALESVESKLEDVEVSDLPF